jgi:hypothetical protein
MSTLETRYRSVLRLLPVSYRQAWEEDMVATFVESMTPDNRDDVDFVAEFGRPAWSEVASVVALAVRLRLPELRRRLGGAGAPPRYAAWGGAVRLVALLGLLAHAAAGTLVVVSALWIARWLPAVPPPPPMLTTDAWQLVAAALGVGWIVAYLALVLGFRRVARVLAVVSLAAEATHIVVNAIRWDYSFAGAGWLSLCFDVIVVAALAAFHRDAPPVRRRYWLPALPIGAAFVTAGFFWPLAVYGFGPDGSPRDHLPLSLMDWPGLCCTAFVLAALVTLVRNTPTWSLALALLAPAVFSLRVFTLLGYVGGLPSSEIIGVLAAGAAQVAAVLAVGVPMTIRATRSMRRLALAAPTA